MKDDPSPEPQLDDIIRELRAEVDITEHMKSSSGSSFLDSENSSELDVDSSIRGWEDDGLAAPPQPSYQQPHNSRPTIASGINWLQGSNQLITTLINELQLSEYDSDMMISIQPFEIYFLV